MPKLYVATILEIDPDANVERVGDIADANFRFFGEMSHDDWVACVMHAKRLEGRA